MQPSGYQLGRGADAGSSALDATFAALADPTRRAILARLALGEATVGELCERFPISQPAVSKHLKVLERAGLVSLARDAQKRPRRLEAAPLSAASEWLERYRELWEARFRLLDALLGRMQAKAAFREGSRSRRLARGPAGGTPRRRTGRKGGEE
jgi:DNA-binding transcriptional ArsR family regulator